MTVLNRNINKKFRDLVDEGDDVVQIYDVPDLGGDYFRKMPGDPLSLAKSAAVNYRSDPLKFMKHELGIPTVMWPGDAPPKRATEWKKTQLPLWSKQKEILKALVKYRKVAVKSGHGVGKSFISAGAALYLHYAWHALGVTTAPTFRQVRRVLWGEIHNLYNNAPSRLGGRLFQTSLESGDKWFIEGFSTKDPSSAFAGFHEENIFVIVDEAGGVTQEVFDTMQGILTSENSFVLLIGNPLDSSSAFADAFRPDSEYHQITISCLDSPNVKNGWNIYPKLTTFDWPEKMKKKWGAESNLYRVRVLGEFPTEGKDTLIPVKYIDQALTLYKEYLESTNRSKEVILSFGVDVARKGIDSTVIGVLRQNTETEMKRFDIIGEWEKQRIDETTDRVIEEYERLVKGLHYRPVINIDDIGLGGGVTDNLIGKGYPVNGLNVGETPDTYSEHEEKFLNKRAQYYWGLRESLSHSEIAIEDDNLAFELSKIGLDFRRGSGKDKIKIEDKEDIRKKLQGKSPDRADCMMLTCAETDERKTDVWIF